MPIMVQQRLISAIREAYADDPGRDAHLARARAARSWLDGLAIDPGLRASIVEPIAAIEETLATLEREATVRANRRVR